MNDLRLISTSRQAIRPLAETALENAFRLMKAGLRQMKQRFTKTTPESEN